VAIQSCIIRGSWPNDAYMKFLISLLTALIRYIHGMRISILCVCEGRGEIGILGSIHT
jgi:hypothetical protein